MADVAAFLGLEDVSLRGISAISKATSDWIDAPKAIANIAKETSVLQQTLSHLTGLQENNSETRDICARIGLSQAVTACADQCARLEPHFTQWTSKTSKHRMRFRFRYIYHKGEVASVLADIRAASQITHLCVNVVQLWVALFSRCDRADGFPTRSTQQQFSMSEEEQRSLADRFSDEIVLDIRNLLRVATNITAQLEKSQTWLLGGIPTGEISRSLNG